METDLKSYRSEFVPVSCNQGLSFLPLKIAFGPNADLHMSRTKCRIMLLYETGFAIYFRGQL